MSPTGNPREFEAALLLDAALRLQSAQRAGEAGEAEKGARAVEGALAHNRRLWSVFLASIAGGDRPLPCEIRQTMASLGLFVSHQSAAYEADPRPERLSALIGLNRDLAAGLLGHA